MAAASVQLLQGDELTGIQPGKRKSGKLLLDMIESFVTVTIFSQHCEASHDVRVEDQAVRGGSIPLDQQ